MVAKLLSLFSCALDNYIGGAEFMEISKGEIKEMVPPTGLAKIMRLLLKVGSFFNCGASCAYSLAVLCLWNYVTCIQLLAGASIVANRQ